MELAFSLTPAFNRSIWLLSFTAVSHQKNVFSKPQLYHLFPCKPFIDSQTMKFQIATSGKPVSQQMWLSSQSVLVSCQHSKLSPHQIVPTSSSRGCCMCCLLCLESPLSPSLPGHLLPSLKHILMFLKKGESYSRCQKKTVSFKASSFVA